MKGNFKYILRKKLRNHAVSPPEEAWSGIAFESTLRERLHGHLAEPPEGMLAGIERTLAGSVATQPARVRPLWSRVVVTAAAACLLVVIGSRYLNRQEVADVEVIAAVESVDPAPAVAPPEPVAIAATSPRPSARLRQVAVAPLPVVSSWQTSVDIPAIEADEEPPYVEQLPVQKRVISVASQDAPIPQPVRAAYRPMRNVHRSEGLTGGSLFASNFAVSRATTPTTRHPAVASESFSSRASSAEMRTYRVADAVEVTHRIPLSIGGEVAIGLGEHLNLHTGLVYTYLRSDFNTPGMRQQLHYLGVPAAVSYAFFRTSLVDFYARGGGMIEKGIHGVRKDPAGNTQLKLGGVQPSLAASVGIEVVLAGSTGLYFEPGVVYYPNMENQPANYRTDHPVTFSMRAGIRLNINNR